jgi:hypothetical protein
MRELRERQRWEAIHSRPFERHARLAGDYARVTLDPPELFLNGRADAIACHLYCQSIYWALRKLQAERGGPSAEQTSEPPSPEALERLWTAELPASTIATLATRDASLLEQARRDFCSKSFADFHELPPEEQVRTARRLSQVATELLYASQTTRQQIDAVWLRRGLSLGAVLVVVALVALGVAWNKEKREAGRDLAAGRPWRASSAYGGYGCKSPQQSCEASRDYFFHTEEQDRPWIEFDLGKSQTIAGLRVDNRKDCCAERIVPIVVEVSRDQEKFTEVARRDEGFRTWRAEFEPVLARYVRIRSTRRTIMHLSRVRILSP